LLGWLVVSVLAICVGGRFFGHYFHQVTAPLAVIAAPAALALWRSHRTLFADLLAVPAAAFLVLGFMHDRVMAAAGEPDPDYHAVTEFLDARAPRSEALCVWGNSPVLYWDADRPLGCRFAFANYLTGMSPATPTQSDPSVDSSMNVVPEAWDMLLADLAARKPPWIVDGSPGNVAFYGKYPPEKFPIGKVLACDYEPAGDVAGMRVYHRRAVTSRTSGPCS
jgi:hypothetical protein